MSLVRLVNSDQEREWIAGLRAGRIDVFRSIFEVYTLELRRFVSMSVPADVSEDIVQDVLFDIWQRRESLPLQDSGLTRYLFAAVRRRTWQYLRNQKVADRVEAENLEPLAMGVVPPSPDSEVIEADLHAAFNSAISHLTELQRSVLMLRWTQQMSYEEVARTLSISPNAAMQHASRIRQVIKPVIEKFFGDIG